jgi:hypothetical protein
MMMRTILRFLGLVELQEFVIVKSSHLASVSKSIAVFGKSNRK